MLAKITRGNQVTIPKEIVKKARLTDSSLYVEVNYADGVIVLKPVTVEERIAPEQFEKFQKWALEDKAENRKFESLSEGIQHLRKRSRKN